MWLINCTTCSFWLVSYAGNTSEKLLLQSCLVLPTSVYTSLDNHRTSDILGWSWDILESQCDLMSRRSYVRGTFKIALRYPCKLGRLDVLRIPWKTFQDCPGTSLHAEVTWYPTGMPWDCPEHPRKWVWPDVQRISGTSHDCPWTPLQASVTCLENPKRDVLGQSWNTPANWGDLISRGSHEGYPRLSLDIPASYGDPKDPKKDDPGQDWVYITREWHDTLHTSEAWWPSLWMMIHEKCLWYSVGVTSNNNWKSSPVYRRFLHSCSWSRHKLYKQLCQAKCTWSAQI